MKKFFENCGWGYVVVFAALILMIIGGAAMMGVGMWGWLTHSSSTDFISSIM